jgi:hypothetical protein
VKLGEGATAGLNPVSRYSVVPFAPVNPTLDANVGLPCAVWLYVACVKLVKAVGESAAAYTYSPSNFEKTPAFTSSVIKELYAAALGAEGCVANVEKNEAVCAVNPMI